MAFRLLLETSSTDGFLLEDSSGVLIHESIDLSMTGVATGEAEGTAIVKLNVAAAGVATAEAEGTAQVKLNLAMTGVGGAPSGGSGTKLNLGISATGVASLFAVGTANVRRNLAMTGVASGEHYGTALLDQQIKPVGAVSGFGAGAFHLGVATQIVMTGVASGERYGTPSLLQLLRFQDKGAASLFQAGLFFIGRPAEVDMVGVDSDEQYGLFAITGGASNEIAYDAYPGRGAVENLVFYAGNSRGLQFTIYNVDTSVTPAVKTVRDITLDTIKWAISKSKGGKYSKTPKLKKTSDPGGGITKIDAANGLVRVFLNNADSVKLKGTFHQELEAFDRFGESEVVAFGSVSILRNVRND